MLPPGLAPQLYIAFAANSFFSLGAIFLIAIDLGRLSKRHGSQAAAAHPLPSVGVIVPSRNEAHEIEACIDSLPAMDCPSMEVTALDGNSTDGTWEKLQAYGDRIVSIREEKSPEGWTGKNWGAYTGYRLSKGELILFTDADMTFGAGLLKTATRTLIGERIHMLALSPEMKMETFWEKTVLPFFAQFVMLLFLPQLMNRDVGRWSMANGQFMLMHRASYEAAGTHSGISGRIVEDIALAQKFREHDMKVRFYLPGEYLSTRMYRGLGEMKEGIVRDLDASMGNAYGLYILDLLYLALTLFIPFPLIWYSAASGQWTLLFIALLSLPFVLLRMLIFQIGTGSPAAYSLLFPISAGAYIFMAGSALPHSLTGKPVQWKGRQYAPPQRR